MAQIARILLAADADNRFLWRMNSCRTEAESIRDSVLHVVGGLDIQMGGSQIDEKWGESSRRRSIYFRHSQDEQMGLLQLFAGANVNSCYRRKESVIPQQALALYNSRIAWERAQLVAQRLARDTAAEDEPEEAFIDAAFQAVLVRPPTLREVVECRRFLRDHQAPLSSRSELDRFSDDSQEGVHLAAGVVQRGRENLVHVLLNHNEFVTVR